MPKLSMQIAHLAPCSKARKYLDSQNTWEEAWNNCPRTDWLLWLIGKDTSIKRERIVVCACAIARTVLKFVKEGELRPLAAIETAERWTKGEATLEDIRKARNGAAVAAHAAAADVAYADAAAAAAAAADVAYAAAAARANAQLENAKIVRQFFPEVPNVLKPLEEGAKS